MDISINIEDKLDEALNGIIKGIDKKALVEAAGKVIAEQAMASFSRPDRRPLPWAPLDPKTIAARNRDTLKDGKRKTFSKANLKNMGMHGGLAEGKILRDTGRLVQSIIAQNSTGESIDVVAGAEYAGYHQFGTKHMPARPFMPFDPGTGELTEMAKLRIEDEIKDKLEDMGFTVGD